jgi:hypothetical protein
MQPPHALTLQKLILELQDALDCDWQFIDRGEELLTRLKVIAHLTEERLRTALEAEPQAHSSPT